MFQILCALVLIGFFLWLVSLITDADEGAGLTVFAVLFIPVGLIAILLFPYWILPNKTDVKPIPVTTVEKASYNLRPLSKGYGCSDTVTFKEDVQSSNDIYAEMERTYVGGTFWTSFPEIDLAISHNFVIHIPEDYDVDKIQLNHDSFKYQCNDD